MIALALVVVVLLYIIVFHRDRLIIVDFALAWIIIGILIAVAADSYDYAVSRAYVSEVFGLVPDARMHAADHYAFRGRWPEGETSLPVDTGHSRLRRVTQRNGGFDAEFGQKAGLLAGHHIAWRPATVQDAPGAPVMWICGYAAAPIGAEIHGPQTTTVPANLLPSPCRRIER